MEQRADATDPAVLFSTPAGAIYEQAIAPQPISATAIRAQLARGANGRQAVGELLPPAVLAYIDQHRLYSTHRMRLNKLQQTAVSALEDIKARDIKVLDVRKLTSFYDTLIIASADSNRQVKALAHHVRDKLKEAGATILGVEGEETRRMGARRLRRHRRARHAARGARVLQPRRAVGHRHRRAARAKAA